LCPVPGKNFQLSRFSEAAAEKIPLVPPCCPDPGPGVAGNSQGRGRPSSRGKIASHARNNFALRGWWRLTRSGARRGPERFKRHRHSCAIPRSLKRSRGTMSCTQKELRRLGHGSAFHGSDIRQVAKAAGPHPLSHPNSPTARLYSKQACAGGQCNPWVLASTAEPRQRYGHNGPGRS